MTYSPVVHQSFASAFEGGTDWELEAEVGAEVGWGGEAGRKI